jgi:hypothetical protein
MPIVSSERDMQESIWFIAKPGEERRFACPTEPGPEWAARLKEQGYKIFRVEFELPEGWDSADTAVQGRIQEVEV